VAGAIALAVAVPLAATVPVLAAPAVDPAAPSFELPAPAAVGQAADVSIALDGSIDGSPAAGSVSIRLAMSREVSAVAPDGGYDTISTIADLDVGQAPAGFDSGGLDALVGVSIAQSFSVTGEPVTAGSAVGGGDGQSVHFADLIGWVGAISIGFPGGPVAVGASWTSAGRAGGFGGIAVPVTYQCRLASVDNGVYALEISYASNFSASGTALGDVSGTIAGWGTITGSLGNPLVVSGSVNQSIDGLATAGGAASPLVITSSMSVQTTGST